MLRKWFCVVMVVVLAGILTGSAQAADKPIKVLIITGDHVAHAWKETTPFVRKLLVDGGMEVDVTEKPAVDLTAENLAKYDVLLLNYRQSKQPPAETKWTEENKKAFAEAVRGGKGLFVYHFASSAFVDGDEWATQYERITAGGWRKQGFHGKRHEYDVSLRDKEHPITKGMVAKFRHANDELYQNSMVFPDCTVLATAWSDKTKDPKNTDKDEPVVWVSMYGTGHVCNNALGHDVAAMADSGFRTLLLRGVEWAARGEVKAAVPDEVKQK